MAEGGMKNLGIVEEFLSKIKRREGCAPVGRRKGRAQMSASEGVARPRDAAKGRARMSASDIESRAFIDIDGKPSSILRLRRIDMLAKASEKFRERADRRGRRSLQGDAAPKNCVADL